MATTSATVSTTSSFINDVSSPYFLHSSDHPGVILVSSPLIRDNYPTWKKAMKMALNAKNKLGFVDGTLKKPSSNSSEMQVWDRCNDMVSSWILNAIDKSLVNSIIYCGTSRDIWLDLEERFSQSNNPRIFQLKRAICTLQQNQQSLVAYYNTLKSYWDELSTHVVISECTCGAFKNLKNHQETERVYQFLMGLNETYSHIRSQILAMDPLPNVSKAYAIINQEEKQHLLHIINPTSTDITAMAAPTTNGPQFSRGTGHGRSRLYCDHCRQVGHIKDKCYFLVGFPPRWNKGRNNIRKSPIGSSSHAASASTPEVFKESTESKLHMKDKSAPFHGLLMDQYNQLLSLLNVNGSSPAANLAGPVFEDADWSG